MTKNECLFKYNQMLHERNRKYLLERRLDRLEKMVYELFNRPLTKNIKRRK